MSKLGTIAEEIFTLVSKLEDQAKTASLDEKVEVGSLLWEVSDVVNKKLDKIKTTVRQEAVQALNGEAGSQVFEGVENGTCSVTVTSPSTKIVKGADMDHLKTLLGPDFSLFFEEVTTYKPQSEFAKRVASSDDGQRKALLRVVEQKENTPRVSFRRKKDSTTKKLPDGLKKREAAVKVEANMDIVKSLIDDL